MTFLLLGVVYSVTAGVAIGLALFIWQKNCYLSPQIQLSQINLHMSIG